MNILILFGHPAFQKSKVNRRLVEDIELIEGVTFHDLYEEYPEMDIDIDREQKLVEEHDCIVFHHPMYWYSAPAIFKEWQDLVLEYEWAYGSRGNAMKGKLFFNAITTGASRIAFNPGEFQEHTVKEFLVPYRQMANLCGMVNIPPFLVHGTHLVDEEMLNTAHQEYHEILKMLVEERFCVDEMREFCYLNDIIKGE